MITTRICVLGYAWEKDEIIQDMCLGLCLGKRLYHPGFVSCVMLGKHGREIHQQ